MKIGLAGRAAEQVVFGRVTNGAANDLEKVTILARATDEKGNTQPVTATWNPLGYFWNSIHRVGIVVDKV